MNYKLTYLVTDRNASKTKVILYAKEAIALKRIEELCPSWDHYELLEIEEIKNKK